MKYLSIDYGNKRIGLAISDELGKFAEKYGFILNKGNVQVSEEILGICEKENIEGMVLGSPDIHNPSNTRQLNAIRAFYKELKKNTEIKIDYWNEEFSSIQARAIMKVKKKKIKNKTDLDIESARIILQEYLDNKNE